MPFMAVITKKKLTHFSIDYREISIDNIRHTDVHDISYNNKNNNIFIVGSS